LVFLYESSFQEDSELPARFRVYENEPWRSRGLRIMPIDHYCVLYIPDKEKAVATIIRVMYGGRDIETQLKKYTRL
jgi:toxin ParE1/3/4